MKQKHAGSRSIGLTLFGIPFLAFGVGFFLFVVGPQMLDWQRMQNWQPVPGTLLEIHLDRHSSDDGTTYSVRAEYRYESAGRTWTGQRVGVSTGADNIGSYHQDLHRRLSRDLNRPNALTVWVNPLDPSQAVLDRDMRWGLLAFEHLFVLLFGGVGLLMVIGGLRRWRAPQIPTETAPAEARRLMAETGDNRIRSGGIATPVALWVLTLITAALTAPGLYATHRDMLRGDPAALAMLAFVAVFLGLLYAAVRTTLGYRRYGRLELVMDPYPGAIGGEFGATLDLRERFDSRTPFPVTLACLHSYTSGSGKSRSTRTSTVWQAEGLAQPLAAHRGTRLGIRFAVPGELPASAPTSSDYHFWRLNVVAEVPGIDLDRSFTIPMLPGSEVSRELAGVPFSDTAGPAPEIPPDILRIRSHGGGTEFFYPTGRHKLAAFMFGLFGVACAAVCIFVGRAIGDGGVFANAGASIVVAVFGLIALLLCAIALQMPFNSLRVNVSPAGISTERRWLGMRVGARHVERDDIERIERVKEMEAQTAGKSIIHYRLDVRTHRRRRITIGESLRGNRLADLVEARVREALDLREPLPTDTDGGSRWTDG